MVGKSRILEEMHSMKKRMDALYMESFREEAPKKEQTESVSWNPMVDILETEDAWMLVADLPGVLDSDLEVELNEDKLTIRGKREALPSGSYAGLLQRERPEGPFSRSFVLPPNARTKDIAAELKAGLLTVIIPKDQSIQATVHKVAVRVE